jgi:hypothetical protein
MEIGKSLPEKYARRLNGSSFRAGFPCPLPRSLATTELARTIVEASKGSKAKLEEDSLVHSSDLVIVLPHETSSNSFPSHERATVRSQLVFFEL